MCDGQLPVLILIIANKSSSIAETLRVRFCACQDHYCNGLHLSSACTRIQLHNTHITVCPTAHTCITYMLQYVSQHTCPAGPSGSSHPECEALDLPQTEVSAEPIVALMLCHWLPRWAVWAPAASHCYLPSCTCETFSVSSQKRITEMNYGGSWGVGRFSSHWLVCIYIGCWAPQISLWQLASDLEPALGTQAQEHSSYMHVCIVLNLIMFWLLQLIWCTAALYAQQSKHRHKHLCA